MNLAFALILIFGILTLWVPGFWAQAAVQAALLLVAAGFCLGPLRHGRPLRFHPMLLPLIGAAAWAAVQASFGLTVLPWLTWNSARDWLAAAAAAFLVLQVFSRRDRIHRAQTVLLWFTVLLSVQALLQQFTGGGKVFWIFDSGYDSDVFGPFVYRNKFAQFVELSYPIAVWRAIHEPRRAPFWIIAAAILFASVVASASRAGFLILTLETAAVPAVAWWRGRAGLRRSAFVAATLAAAVFGAVAVTGWTGLGRRLFGLDPLQDYRLPILASTWDMILSRPFTGWGLGTWAVVYPQFARFDAGLFVNQAHNDWAQWWAEGGLPMLLFMLWWAASLWRSARSTIWGIGPLFVLLHGLVDYPLQQLPVFSCLVASVAALSCGASARALRSGAPPAISEDTNLRPTPLLLR